MSWINFILTIVMTALQEMALFQFILFDFYFRNCFCYCQWIGGTLIVGSLFLQG
jgi:hypothetical protein